MPSKTSSRAIVWRGHLVFAMVAIPVRIYKAGRKEQTKFHQLYRPSDFSERGPEPTKSAGQPTVIPFPGAASGAAACPDAGTLRRIHNRPVTDDNVVIEKDQLLKGYEFERGRYVVVDPAEVAALHPQTSTEIEIQEFVRLAEIDPVFLAMSYYVVPESSGERPYALLFAALKESGYVGIGMLAMHRRETPTVIRPGQFGLILHTMFYENEVRAGDEFRVDPQLVSEKDLALAKMLINARAAEFDPEKRKNVLEERLQEFLAGRISSEPPFEFGQGSAALTAALRKSLEITKKPVKSDNGTSTTESKHRNEPRKR